MIWHVQAEADTGDYHADERDHVTAGDCNNEITERHRKKNDRVNRNKIHTALESVINERYQCADGITECDRCAHFKGRR